MRKATGHMTGGQLIVAALEAQGVTRVHCVPGESYLAVLDALHDSKISVTNARHEGGAAMMAEADGKLTGRPGICMVTRGPGATNASAGVHVAQQDSTPMILFVGQIEMSMRGRDAFQEVDYTQFFGGMAKWVAEIESADRVTEMVARAYATAMSGRPGPVVLVLPENMLVEEAPNVPLPFIAAPQVCPSSRDMQSLQSLLDAAKNPMVIVGGSGWDEQSVADLKAFSERFSLPVAVSFRRQMLFDHLHANYAGDVGLGINPKLLKRIAEADLVIALGDRLSEVPSQSFTLFNIPVPRQKLVHVLLGAEELGRVYQPELGINADPGSFLVAALTLSANAASKWEGQAKQAHDDYLAWSTPQKTLGDVQMGEVMTHLAEVMPDDTILTNGAGNYATWVHRFWRFRHFATQAAPTSGSMGYGMPGAVAAKLRFPEREVICFAGDGCFQMTGMEFATAVQEDANILVIVVDNGMYGTIRMHQEMHYPARLSATRLVNPDFAALARAYGGHGETITRTDDFPAALERARNAGKPALLHLIIDPQVITPTKTLDQLRAAALN